MSLNVALVGYGFAGKTFHAPLVAATQALTLHTVVSSDAAKVRADWPTARVVSGVAEALSDPAIRLVVIATPTAQHGPIAHAAIQAGKAVVIDKPFAVTAAEAKAVAEHAERAGIFLSVFHNRRWDSDFLTLKRLMGEGRLGQVVQYESHFDRFRPEVRARWREQAGPGSGAWLDLGPHLVDQTLQLFGEPLAVTADIASQRRPDGADDYFHVVLRYPTLRAILHGSMLTAAPGARLTVHGTGGSYLYAPLDPQEDQLRAGVTPGAPGWGSSDYRPTLTTVQDGARVDEVVEPVAGDYRAYYAAVALALENGGPNPVSPAQALRVMEVLELAVRSSAKRREIAL